MEVRRTALRLTGWACLAAFWTAAPMAFVPSAEKELAALYPPLLRGDLSACTGATGQPAPQASADLGKFTRRLNGSWELTTRTIHGITVSRPGRMARLYFDMQPASTGVSGAALLVDRAAGLPLMAPVVNGQSVAAFWNVGVGRDGPRRLAMSMSGETLGAYRHVQIRNIDDARFIEFKDVFVAVDRNAPLSAAWDKIVLTEKSMTYVSCGNGVVERYTKLSSTKPLVDGQSLESSWQTMKTALAAARLSAPRNAAPGR